MSRQESCDGGHEVAHSWGRPALVVDVVFGCLRHLGNDGVEDSCALVGQRPHHGRCATHYGPDQVLRRTEANHLHLGTELDLPESGTGDHASEGACMSEAEWRKRCLLWPDSAS